MCNILLEKSQRGLQLCFKPHFNWKSAQEVMALQNHKSPNLGVITLALGSQPRQGFASLQAKRKPKSEGKCEGMNPHTPKGAPTLGVWSLSGLSNFQRVIVRVKTQWIEYFFISLESH